MAHKASIHHIQVVRGSVTLYLYVELSDTIFTVKNKILHVFTEHFPGRPEIAHPEGLKLSCGLFELRCPEDIILDDSSTVDSCNIVDEKSVHATKVLLLYKNSHENVEAIDIQMNIGDSYSTKEIDEILNVHV
ncbi:MAG: hypothetical protein BVN35_06150 [Proteobacteria bacterium ST_bin11]|nr:MAG: hypothetical protein BVN35_06150 [Proteobacteria bacterium ST_bin11]